VLFAFGVSALWLAAYNTRFWADTFHAMGHGTASSAFLVSLGVLTLCAQALLLLLLPSRRLMLGGASLLFLIAALGSYFSSRYGIVMDKDMLRNVFQTDLAEARSLVSPDLIAHVIVLGVAPALLVWRIRLPAVRWRTQLLRRAVASGSILAVCALAVFVQSASYAVFLREHKPIRFTLMPAAPVTSAIAAQLEQYRQRDDGSIVDASGPAVRTAPVQLKPLVLVMVVGETARAANFQLGGYARATNPQLSALQDIIYFPNTIACGTSTAISVPCIFSHLPRQAFDVDEAQRFANLLDALRDAGLDVEWRDNNAGCKGVCVRVRQIDYRENDGSPLCHDSNCYDEIMLTDLETKLRTLTHDTVIVMHQIGSHGPAYSERYPTAFETFRPACRSNRLQECSHQEVVNAYDNSIAYTDHVLARTVATLRSVSTEVDAMLLCVSDHGESLGEQGVYLHGLPYPFAPDTQKHVPMLMWLSPEYAARRSIDMQCVRGRATDAFSHDNIYHTVLGASEVRNATYDAKLDILAACRNAQPDSQHE
jgi:lipid A ethanolaminephosphotransferase